MQNRYVGDVGDFGKYWLLRALCLPDADGDKGLSLGVVWHLVPDEGHNADGKHTGYLEPTAVNVARYGDCDPFLYDTLAKIVDRKARNVTSIRNNGILPAGTVFFEEPLTFAGMPSIGAAAREARLKHRSEWLQRALEATAGCDVVFIDPDNGLEVKTQRHTRRGPKHVFFDELVPYLRRGQSLIIYHHIARKGSAVDQIQQRLSQIAERLRGCDAPFALRYHRGTSRALFVVPTKAHSSVLVDRAKRFASGLWGEHKHFCLVHPRST
jgi:hypothetical protein